MNKIYLICLSIQIAQTTISFAQNIQLHYDFGSDRRMLTSTLEYFNLNDKGSIFYFVDINYGGKINKVQSDISQVYFEIVKGLKFWKPSFEIHTEYNGGIGQFMNNDQTRAAFTINNAWLLGGHYTFSNSSTNNTLTLQGMYKYIQHKHNASFQITMIWNLELVNDLIFFQGFADYWREDQEFIQLEQGNSSNTGYVFLTEPQIWFHIYKGLLLGGEVEIGNNFGGTKGLQVNPTFAFKWEIK